MNFPNCSLLSEINCELNNITKLDLTKVATLTSLNCSWNDLTSLDVSNLTNLSTLNCDYTNLDSLDISSSENLKVLYLGSRNERMNAIDLSKNLKLDSLTISYYSQITSLDVSNHKHLRHLDLLSPELVSVNASDCPLLEDDGLGLTLFGITYKLEYINLSGCVSLTDFMPLGLYPFLTKVNLSGCKSLETVECGSSIKSLILSDCDIALVKCIGTNLASVDLSGATIDYFDCCNSQNNELTFLNSSNASINLLECDNSALTSINLSNVTVNYLNCCDCNIEYLNVFDSNTKDLIAMGCPLVRLRLRPDCRYRVSPWGNQDGDMYKGDHHFDGWQYPYLFFE